MKQETAGRRNSSAILLNENREEVCFFDKILSL